MAATDALGSVPAATVDRRRHSVDVASMTYQLLKPNGVTDLQPQSTCAAPSGVVQAHGKRSRYGNAMVSQGRGRPPASGGTGSSLVDITAALKDAQGKSMQGQGLFRRPYNGLGFITRLSPSGRPMTSLPVTEAHANMVVGPERVTAACRSSSPRPTLRRALAVTGGSDELRRVPTYEEELEARLRNVRQRTLDVERRFVTEQLKRRQAMLLAEVLERQHLETVSRLSTESQRRIDQLKARCEEVREDCRRRIADVENESIAKVERLEAQLMAVESELSVTKQQLERYKDCRVINPGHQRDVDTQVNLYEEAETASSSSLPAAPITASDSNVVDKPLSLPVVPPSEQAGESEQAWDRFYDVLTSLAFNRVRYLEEQLAAANRHDQQPELVCGRLRRLKTHRHRAVTGSGSDDVSGSNDVQSKTLGGVISIEDSSTTPLPVPSIVNSPKHEQLPVDDCQSTARTVLHRTSSCPSPEVAVVTLDDDSHQDAVRSQSETGEMARGDEAESDVTSSLAESGSGSGATVDLSFSSLPTVSEMSDSVSISMRQSPCSDDDDDDIPDIPDDRFTTDSIAATSTPTEARSPIAMTTPPMEESPRPRAIPKRNSNLSLDIFRKLQATRRRERPSSSATQSTNHASDDDRSDDVSPGQERTASRNSTPSSSNADLSVSPLKTVHGQIERASSMLNTSSSSSTSLSDGGRRKAPLVHSLPSSQAQSSDDSGSTLVDAVDDETPETTSLNDVANDDVVSSKHKRRSRGNTRPKSSSFGRLRERRNGLVSTTSLPFGVTSSPTGLLGGQPRITSQSRLDSLAKNIKHYLTSQ